MVAQSTLLLTDVVRHEAKPLAGEIDDYDPLLKMIGDARLELTLRNHGSATTALREPKLDRANFRMGKETTMQTRQIPKSEWPAFLDRFSRQHEGWLVKLEILSPDFGAQVQETGLALEGLTDEWDEAEGNTIMIMAGNEPDAHMTHSISDPTEVTLEQTDEGADVALSIKSADGTRALLSFRAAVLPETVDAFVA